MNNPELFNPYRIKDGPMKTTDEAGANGAFLLNDAQDRDITFLITIASTRNWEHLCVTKHKKAGVFQNGPKQLEPTAQDMRSIKQVFFQPSETCVEFFPEDDSALHAAPLTRHLWRHQFRDFPIPEIPKPEPPMPRIVEG